VAIKTHITKIDNDQVERGVQMRTDQPGAPVDKQIWFNEAAGNISVFVGGIEKVLNLRILPNDPAIITEGEAWINHTTSALKYKYGGVVYTMAIGASISDDGSQNTGGYLKTLGEAELRTISDVTLNYPSYMIDSFNDVKTSAVYTDTELLGSRLRISGTNTSGSYTRSDKISNVANHVDGIVVASVQSLAAHDINAAGADTVLSFYKDVRGIIGNVGKLMVFEKMTWDGQEKNIYMIDPTTSNPKKFTIVSAVYNSVTNKTSVTITNEGYDVAMGYTDADAFDKVRFIVDGLAVECGGDLVAAGSVNLEIKEAYNLATRRVLGEDIVTTIEKTYVGGITEIGANCSANKLNWLIVAKVRRPIGLGDDYVVWYSVDGLKTIQQATGFTSPASPSNEAHASANDSYSNDLHNSVLRKENIIIHDDGRFIFGHRFLNAAVWYKMKGYFGKLTGGTIDIRMLPKAHDGDGEISIGARSEFEHLLAMDWDTDYMAATFMYSTVTPSYDAYLLFYKFNWTTMTCQYLNYCHPGVMYIANYYPVIMFWKTFEGEKMLFWATTHNTGLTYAYKYPQANIANITTTAANISAVTYDNGLGATATQLSAFCSSTIAGTRGERNDWTNQSAASGRWLAHCWNNDETELLVLKADDQTNLYLVTLNFGRTSRGQTLAFVYNFVTVPVSGTYTITITNTRTSVVNTTAAIAFNATAAQVKTALELLANVGAGKATVTGDYLSGFAVAINQRDEFLIATTSSALNAGAAAAFLNNSYTQFSASPVYLHYPVVGNVTTIYQYSALGSMIALDANVGPLYAHESGHVVAGTLMGRYLLNQRMLCGENNEVYIAADWAEVTLLNDAHRSRFMKIPNYKECRGLHFSNAPATPVNNYIAPAYNQQLAHIWTVPAAGNYLVAASYAYPDGFVHIRTVGLYIYHSYQTQKCPDPSHKYKVKICTVSGGLPTTTVLAESIWIREIDLPPYIDFKWYNFPLTTDLRLAPGQQVAIVIEPNFNINSSAEGNPTGLAPTTRGLTTFVSGTGTGMCAMNAAGVWATVASSLYFRLFDMYYGHTSDMQGNVYYQGPSQLSGASSNEDSESTIAWTSDRTAKKISITYRNGDVYSGTGLNFAGDGAHAKTWIGYIDDVFSPYAYPAFSTPTIMGNNDSIDPYQVFGVNFGDDSSRFLNSRTGATETIGVAGNILATEGFNYRAYGGIPFNAASSVDMLALVSRTGNTIGIILDADFAAGRALQFGAASYVQYRYGTYGIFPGAKDFCVEFEYKPSAADLVVAGNQRMIIDMEGFIRCEIQAGKYQFNAWGNPSETWSFRSLENVLPGHQIIRYGRTFASGAFIHVSYDKGVSWTVLSPTGVNAPASISGGRVLGLAATGFDIIRMGGYSQAVGYDATGAIGYVKFIVGAAAPMYTGLTNMNALDFRRFYNFGDRAICMRLLQNTYSTVGFNFAAPTIAYYDGGLLTSLKPTCDQVFKYRQAIPAGRQPFLKLDLTRESTSDPASIQGYLVNFERKD
jgi:hypothetical protein